MSLKITRSSEKSLGVAPVSLSVDDEMDADFAHLT